MNPSEKVSHLDFLESLVQRAAATAKLPSTRVSPEVGLKAVEAAYRISQGAILQDWLAAFADLEEELDEQTPRTENPQASMSTDEAIQGSMIDLSDDS
jgi:hypothetical protein